MMLAPRSTGAPRPMVLLAPSSKEVSPKFTSVQANHLRHKSLLAQAQRLRGQIYLQDGAIKRFQLSADGRFVQDTDDSSWHLLVLDSAGRVAACARYRMHRSDANYSGLGVARSAMARSEAWSANLQWAVEAELHKARQRNITYAEVGGWALSPEVRCTTEALRMALSMYGMGRLFGGALGLSTATTRHHSSSILRRIGGRPLTVGDTEIPPYFDHQYMCEMEILRFDSKCPNGKYESWIETCERELANVQVIAGAEVGATWTQLATLNRELHHADGRMPAGAGDKRPVLVA